jgi:mono/diheme cytochrome c family protein
VWGATLASAALAATLLVVTATASPQSAERTNWDGVFTRAQAERGSAIYTQQCALCHGPSLTGADGPPLAGVEFASNWNDLTLGDLSERIRTAMPPDNPGKLSAQDRADVMAHILNAGNFPAGERELGRDLQEQRQVRFKATKP